MDCCAGINTQNWTCHVPPCPENLETNTDTDSHLKHGFNYRQKELIVGKHLSLQHNKSTRGMSHHCVTSPLMTFWSFSRVAVSCWISDFSFLTVFCGLQAGQPSRMRPGSFIFCMIQRPDYACKDLSFDGCCFLILPDEQSFKGINITDFSFTAFQKKSYCMCTAGQRYVCNEQKASFWASKYTCAPFGQASGQLSAQCEFWREHYATDPHRNSL